MALLTAVLPVFTGVVTAGAAVSSSDTIADANISPNGCILVVINGNVASTNVTVSDPGFSPMGNAGTATAVTVSASTSKAIRIPPSAVNSSTGVATVAFSVTSSVTYQLFKL